MTQTSARQAPKPPPPQGADLAAWIAAIAALPVDFLDQLAPLFSKSLRARARHAQRDAFLIALAVGRQGDALSIATEIHKQLSRYRASAWRFETDRAAPHDPRHQLAHQLLKVGGGHVLSIDRIRKILRPLSVGMKTRCDAHRNRP